MLDIQAYEIYLEGNLCIFNCYIRYRKKMEWLKINDQTGHYKD